VVPLKVGLAVAGLEVFTRWMLRFQKFLSESIMLKLNTSKCKVLSVGRNLDKTYKYDIEQDHQTTSLERVESIRDLGVLVDERLSFSEHMQDKINEAYAMLGVIK